MKKPFTTLLLVATNIALLSGSAQAATFLDEEKYGKSLGGWTEKSDQAATYEISGSKYRTWKPTATPTPDGGTFISVRIDHLRGLLASDDYASLELSINSDGDITTARSSLALQGKKITSDLIRNTGTVAGKATGLKGATKMGTDLLADLTSKLLREKVTEPGRVTFPAAVQHNYNLLCLALWDKEGKKEPTTETPADPDLAETLEHPQGNESQEIAEATDAGNPENNEKTSLKTSEQQELTPEPNPIRKYDPLQIETVPKKVKALKK